MTSPARGPVPGDPDWWPPHIYRLHRTPRHPEGLFDPIRATARPGMSAEALRHSAAWRDGRRFLNAGLGWEAHEVMEAVWLSLPDGPEKLRVQAAIQLANMQFKTAIMHWNAVRRLGAIVTDLLDRSAGPEAEQWFPRIDMEDIRDSFAAIRTNASQ